MLDIKYIVNNIDEVIKKLNNRNNDFSYLKNIVNLSNKKNELIFKLEKLNRNKNLKSKKFFLFLSKNENKEIIKIKKEISIIKKEITLLEKLINDIKIKIKNILEFIPNIPDNTVPIGKSEKDNIIIKKWNNNKNKFNLKEKKILDHIEISKKLNIIDFKRGVKLSGSRFIVYKGIGAKLQRILINFMIDYHEKNGFIELNLPVLVNKKTIFGTGHLPKFNKDLYFLEKEELYLIPTSEVSITNMYSEEIILEKSLPIYHTSFSPCFRKEAGAGGKDINGLIRLHQFNKVELVILSSPENSFNELEKLVYFSSNILKLLNLSYRIILLSTYDLGFSSSKTYDIEVWMPSKNNYVEISSCSNCIDFQSRRMKTKYRDKNGNLKFVHTLNGSALAIDRLIAAILENYQNPDGTISIPNILQPYFNYKKIF